MTSSLSSNAERRAKLAENYPAIFGALNLTDIRDKVGEILKLIGRDGIFREYTLHDADHINELLALVEKLIPPDTASEMKTADWLMIVLACYFHDLGMVVTKQEYENRYNGTDFKTFKTSLLAGDKGKDYEDALAKLDESEREEFLYQEFVRKHHAKRIAFWIRGQDACQYGDAKGAVEVINSLLGSLEPVFRDDLARICLSHHEDDLFDFEKYRINRVYGEDPEGECNLHYAALILRSADVLQIQKKRVPTVLYQLIDPSNPKSQEEWAKQAGVRAVKPRLVPGTGDSDTIEVHAAFDREDAYFGLLAYLQQYAAKELERCADWATQAEKKGSRFRFPWKQIDSSQVEPRGFEGRTYGFRLDQERILRLLTGHTLYNDYRVAIREVLQNALDAVRFRKHQVPLEPIGKIDVVWNSSTRTFMIRDTGTGMTQETIEKFLLNVGSSFYQSEAVRQKYAAFSPISRFGIGILSTFMIADAVKILTVHPDDEFAHQLTLPSVVKSYLVKKVPKGDSAVQAIGSHGTEVTLQVRRSAELKDVESLVRYWMVLPGCEVTCTINGATPVGIGFVDARAVLQYYHELLQRKSPWKSKQDIRVVSKPGIELGYVVTRSEYVDVWDFAGHPYKDHEEARDLPDAPGICVEGIRVLSTPAGYTSSRYAPSVFANLTGPRSPKTNVARSDLEQTPEFDAALLEIYSLLGSHAQSEFERLLAKNTGIVDAAREADLIVEFGLRTGHQSSPKLFDQAMANLRVIALEDGQSCRNVSRGEIDLLPEAWTVDSRLLKDLEGICGSLEINETADIVIGKLGKAISPAIPLPRILGESKTPVQELEIADIRIHLDKYRRIDLCWRKKSERWTLVPERLLRRLSSTQRSRYERILIANEGTVFPECAAYNIVVWRRWCLILTNSPILKLLQALGMNDRFVRWLFTLFKFGGIPSEDIPLFKHHLNEAGKTDDGLIQTLILPFEMRYDSQIKRQKPSIMDSENW